MIPNPRPRAETEDDLALQAAWRAEIDILERRGMPQFRVTETLGQFPLFACRPQADAVLETECGVLRGAPLFIKRGGHRVQMQRLEAAFDGGAHGVLLSRKYSEMRLANLRAAGRAVRDLKVS
jgi:hypothetical protein